MTSPKDPQSGATCKTCGGTVPNHKPSILDRHGAGHPDHKIPDPQSELELKRGRIWIPGWTKICKAVMERENGKCQECGMTNEEHRARWGRRLTVDHVDGDLTNNDPSNLKLLCLPDHASKDGLRTHISPIADQKEKVIEMYKAGYSQRKIAELLGVGQYVISIKMKRWGFAARTKKEAHQNRILAQQRFGKDLK